MTAPETSEEVALVAVQLRVAIEHFADEHSFRRLIEDAAARAGDACTGVRDRLFVFPEGVGYFAPLVHAPEVARRRSTVDAAMAVYAAAHPIAVARELGRGTPEPRAALLRALVRPVDALMRSVFSRVARHHAATVVAGSHLRVGDGGRVTNSSYTFDPSGRLCMTTDKVNLVPTLEDDRCGGLDLSPGAVSDLRPVDAGWGRVATLICYDGFREAHTRAEPFTPVGAVVDVAGADVIANPAANSWAWHGEWYFAEVGEHLVRCDQWRMEGLPATLSGLSHTRYGVTAHLCGGVMDQRFEGRSEVLQRDGDDVRVLAAATTIGETEAVMARVPAMR